MTSPATQIPAQTWNGGAPATDGTCAFTSNVAGRTIVALEFWGGAAPAGVPTDGAGNTYVQVATITNALFGNGCTVYWVQSCLASAGTNTVTSHTTTPQDIVLSAVEYPPCSAIRVSATNQAGGASGTPVVSLAGTSVSDIVAFIAYVFGATAGVGNVGTNAANNIGNVLSDIMVEDGLSSGGTINVTETGTSSWWHAISLALTPAGGGGGGPSTDQVPLIAALATPRPVSAAARRYEVVAPIGALIVASLSSVGWGPSTPLPAKAQQSNAPAIAPTAPVGTGTFALPKLAHSVSTLLQPKPLANNPPALQASQPTGPLKPFVSASFGFGLVAPIPFDTPLVPRQVSESAPVGTRIGSSTLTSIGWLQIDTASPRPAQRLVVIAVADNVVPGLMALPWFDSYLETKQAKAISVNPQPSAPVGALITGGLTSLGWLGVDQRTSVLPRARVQDTSAPTGPLTPFVSPSTGFFGSSSASPVVSAPRAQEAQQPVGALKPFVSASSGFQTVETKAPPALGPRAQEVAQPTGPLTPFVSASNGWDAPISVRQSVFSVRTEPSTPVGTLMQLLTSIGWMGPDTRAPVLPAPRAQETAQPTGTLLTPQPFGWAGYDQAPPAPVIPRRVEPIAPVGTAFAIALPSNGWLATDNPRTPLALSKSVPVDPVGSLLVLPPLPNLTWLATDNPRTPYSSTRAVVVDPVGSPIPLPGQHGPFWFVDQNRTVSARRPAPDTSAPVGALFATLSSVGWLSPFDAPRAPVVAQRPQPSNPLRALQFGGSPWSTVDVQPGRAAVARAPEIAAPVGSLLVTSLSGIGWQWTEQQRQPPSVAPRSQESAGPTGPLNPFVSASFGWQTAESVRSVVARGRDQETVSPIGAAFGQTLTSLGWLTTEATAPRAIFSRVSPVEPVGLFMPPPVLPGMGWNYVMELPPRWSFVARPVPSEPVGSSFALGFRVAPLRRSSPVFDLSGVGRMSPIFREFP